MTVYAVIFDDTDDPREDRFDRIEAAYPGPQSHQHTESIYFVDSDDGAAKVKRNAGIGKEYETGIIIAVSKDYEGFTDRGLWNWLIEKVNT